MNENNINSNLEASVEGAKTPVYSSKFLMNKDLFYNFGSVSYNRTKKVFLFFLCLTIFETVINILDGNYDIFALYPLVSFLMLLIYFRTKKAIKINYERNLISEGKESTLHYELFEDKIVSNIDGLKREYFYHQITKFFETKNFLLLHLRHNLYITIEKSNLNASVDEVKSFLFEKCTLVKKKKFINCINDKKWSLIFLISLIVVSFIATFVSITIKLNTLS